MGEDEEEGKVGEGWRHGCVGGFVWERSDRVGGEMSSKLLGLQGVTSVKL